MTVPRRSGSNSSHSSNSSSASNSWTGLKTTAAASTANTGVQRGYSLSAHPSSSSSSSLSAAVFSSLTFFVFPGFDRPALTATIQSYGGSVKSSSNFTLPASSLTAQSPQALRSLTAAFAFLAAHAEDGRLIPVLEPQDVRLMRELLQDWRRERAGRWKEEVWVRTARSVSVYSAALVYDSRRKGRMQDRLRYRVQLFEDERKQGKADEDKTEKAEEQPAAAAALSTASRPQPQQAAKGQKRKRGSDGDKVRASLAVDLVEDSDEEVEVETRPRSAPRAQKGAKRARLSAAQQQQPVRQREESKKAEAEKSLPAATASAREEEEEDEIVPGTGDELTEEQQQQVGGREKELERVHEEKDGDAETVQATDGSDGDAAASADEPPPPLLRPLPQLPLIAVRKEDEATGDAAVEEAAELQPALAAQQQTVMPTQRSSDGSADSRSSATESSAASSLAGCLIVAARICSTLSQPSEGKDVDIIYETPPSQQLPSAAAASQHAPAAAAPASPATSDSSAAVVPSSSPSSSTPSSSGSSVPCQPASEAPSLSFPFPLPVVLHAIFAHSGSTAAALRHLMQLPCCCARGHEGAEQGCEECGAVMAWTAAEDALLMAEDSDADTIRALESARSRAALQQRRLFLTAQTV